MLLRHAGVCHSRYAPCARKRNAGVVRFKAEERDQKGDVISVYTTVDQLAGGICPHSQAVLITLLEKGLPFRATKVDPAAGRNPEFTELYHSIIPDTGEKERVPLLVDGTVLLTDAAVITEYLERQYAASGTPLLPDNPAAQARIKLFIQYFSDCVVPPFQRLLRAEGEEAVADATAALGARLEGLNAMLQLHGYGDGFAFGPHMTWSMHAEAPGEGASGPYLLGPHYSLAEVAATPFVARMVQVLPEWRGVDVWQMCSERRLDRLAAWMRGCMERPSAQMTDPTSDELLNGLAEWEWSHAMQ